MIHCNRGGLEYLFNNQKQYTIILNHITSALHLSQPTLTDLIKYLATQLCDKQRIDMFITVDNTVIDSNSDIAAQIDKLDIVNVRPGILVLVNDCDWELFDCGAYQLKDGDTITMISTLHGG